MIKVLTNFPIAIDSPDHTHPWGTYRDNSNNNSLMNEIKSFFNNEKVNILDLGCAGGAFIVSSFINGNLAVGLEGSDYNLVNDNGEQSKQWKEYHNKCLFTCDISRPFQIVNDYALGAEVDPILFDCIMEWEVLEHIHPDRLDIFFENIKNHLKPTGIFIGSISMNNDASPGIELHQSIFTEAVWKEKLSQYFNVSEYKFNNRLRSEGGSFFILLTQIRK